MKTRSERTTPTRVERVAEALVVAVVDGGDDRGEDAADDEPVDLLDVVVGVRAARDARRRVEVDDADDGERSDAR